VRARIAQEVHDLVKLAICQQYAAKGKLPPRFKQCEITITAYFRGRKRRDIDNVSEKLYLDGLVNEDIIADDNLNIVKAIHKYAYYDQPEDKVVIELQEIQDELHYCKNCHCMTKTINGKCGKCKEVK